MTVEREDFKILDKGTLRTAGFAGYYEYYEVYVAI